MEGNNSDWTDRRTAALIEGFPAIPDMPKEVFLAIGKKMPMVTVDLVITHPSQMGRFLLTLREKKDAFWPNQWHFPGGFVGYQETMENACRRIAFKEAMVKLEYLEYLGINEHLIEEYPRGHSISIVYLARASSFPSEGKFFKVENLPENFIKMHRKIIKLLPDALRPFED